MTTLEKILFDKGPLISSELTRQLSIIEKVPINTASQRVSRNKKVKKIKGFFISNQSFCYLEEHYKNGLLYESVSEAMFNYGRKYWYCLNAIKMHGGIINQKFLECYTNYPIEPLKRHIPFKKVMQKFISEGILVYTNSEYIFSPKFSQLKTNSFIHRTIEIMKEDILSHFHSMLKNTGMISFNTGETFTEFGKFRWCFKGVSYIRGVVENGKPGYVLADILFGKEVFKEDIQFFIEKLNHIQSFKNSSKIIPFIIVDDLHTEALTELKKNGIVVGLIKELFGEKYAIALRELVSILNNAGASLKSNPNKYLELIEELKVYNKTLVYNIRGELFEYFVGHIHSIKSQVVDLGREIYENNAKHEIDVFAIYNDKVVFVECKATNSQIDIVKINKWINTKIPAFKNWLLKQETLKNHSLEFEYWATGGFTVEADLKLKSISESSNKFKVSHFSQSEIKHKTIEMKNKKMKDALNNFFFKSNI